VFDASDPVKITMLPGVAHAFENVGDSDAYILGYSDRRFDASDIEPCALIT
jgi:quercetin dioxygenase-like cupin family protein